MSTTEARTIDIPADAWRPVGNEADPYEPAWHESDRLSCDIILNGVAFHILAIEVAVDADGHQWAPGWEEQFNELHGTFGADGTT